MDVWEHAFLLDYKPAERPKYIEAFFANVKLAGGRGAACESGERVATVIFASI